ncbi:MAG TPA: hypothetical protein PLX49_12960, partial [Prolixibacteraceae bacterium]|nr:hypothetical protein [Prolixibacteraceae bacterium]
LSDIPVNERQKILLVWFNDPLTSIYDHSIYKTSIDSMGINNLDSYNIEANKSPKGLLPKSGWVELAEVTSNTFHSRQHLLNLQDYNWIRIRIKYNPIWMQSTG